MPHLPAPRARRLLPLLHLPIIVALLLGIFTAVPPTRAAQTGLTWPDGSTFTSFGGNEVITIDLGIMQFVNGCPTGINDFIYPFADVYVMPSGSVSQGSQLVDVVGRPNTVMGASGGIFVSEVIGATGPGGPIGPGTYAVVYDECQDGTFDANDSLFDPAFEVTIPANLPPINPLA
ncbi:MAG: hypothetical protein KC425_19110, partial [Anaerolineales bacterium]|nr:hypothetical protein [Anaerolineales bacterium]